ncbi:hypothetical protein [Rhodococcus sp. HNM0569]|uniref:hypothetical protein n=1 Tax=Rhodococcus sp. HNM0569 TaxID=2716340 RepID=UPI00146E1CB8|nr:hypothetical protein [Rhodococcus sp. HNM0569]NLU84105.1 hypothetical protein [Rhodococcus sp. HNM0569]
MSDDSQQISVAELLKRNGGQQMESRGGRRRRGVSGGVSVAELTGEIPVVGGSSAHGGESDTGRGRRAAPEPADPPKPSFPARSAAVSTPAPSTPAPSAPAPSAPSRSVSTGSSVSTAASRGSVAAPARAPESRPSLPTRTPKPAPAASAPPAAPASRSTTPRSFSTPSRALEPPRTPTPPRTPEPDSSPTTVTPPVGAPATSGTSRGHEGAWVSVAFERAKPTPSPISNIETDAKGSVPVVVPQADADEHDSTRDDGDRAHHPRRDATPSAHSDGMPEQREPALLSGGSLAAELLRRRRRTDDARDGDADARTAADEDADARPDGETELIDKPAIEEGAREDEREDDREQDPDERRESLREWAVLGGQAVAAVVAGALMFKGFEKLWGSLPWVALVLAVLVIVGLVAVVRILRRTDDITSFVIAVVVGMIVTLGPLAFMLTG